MGVLSAALVRKPKDSSLLLKMRIILRWIALGLFAGLVFMTVKDYDSYSTPMATVDSRRCSFRFLLPAERGNA